MDTQIQSPDPPRDGSRYPPGDSRGRYLAAIKKAEAARRAAAEAEVLYSAGKGSHEDADRLRSEADEAEAEVLRAKADAGNRWMFDFRAGTSHPATAPLIRGILVDAMAEQLKPVWDFLNGRIDQLEAEVAAYRAKEVSP